MNIEERLKLFISLSNPGRVFCNPDLKDSLQKSEVYYYLQKNIEKAKKYETARSKQVVDYYNKIRFDFISMESYIVEYSKIYFIATQSFERYYINPLVIKEGDTNLKSLGDLMFVFDGQLIPFNKIIKKGDYSLDYKKRMVAENVSVYRKEMYELIEDKANIIKKKKLTKRKLSFSNILNTIELVCCLLFSALMILVFILPGLNADLLAKPFSDIGPSLILLYFIWLIIYLSLFIITSTWHNRLFEPVFYTRRLLRLKRNAIFSLIDKKCNQLEKYYNNALESGKKLHNDIYSFSGYKDSIISFDAVDSVNRGIKSRGYSVMSAIKNISFGVMVLLTLALSVYMLYVSLTKGSLF